MQSWFFVNLNNGAVDLVTHVEDVYSDDRAITPPSPIDLVDARPVACAEAVTNIIAIEAWSDEYAINEYARLAEIQRKADLADIDIN